MAIAGKKIKKSSGLSRRDEDILKLLNLPIKVQKQKPTQIVKWSPPTMDWFKLNVEGSSLENPRSSGLGGVIRDHRGDLLVGFSICIGIRSYNVAEFMDLL